MAKLDPFDLARFKSAQAGTFDTAYAELLAGRKRSHWMWFVFPQLRGLGVSPTAQYYGLASLAEARAFLVDDLLSGRLEACTRAVLAAGTVSLHDIFGSPDDAKFRSSMTIFEAADVSDFSIFAEALDRCCAGARDDRTLALLGR